MIGLQLTSANLLQTIGFFMLPTSIIAIFTFSFFIAIGAVVSPGPISTAIVSQSPRQGWRAGPLVATGHSLTELIMVLLIVFGLGLALTHPAVQVVIAFVGGALLLYMGCSMVWDTFHGKIRLPRPDDGSQPMGQKQLVGLGILATLSYPFWYAWWVTVGAGYLTAAKAINAGAVAAFYLGHISADYAWDVLLSTVIGWRSGGRYWMNDRIYQGIILLCGAFFLYLGAVFLWQGIHT